MPNVIGLLHTADMHIQHITINTQLHVIDSGTIYLVLSSGKLPDLLCGVQLAGGKP